jgi:acyl-coenzyme A thioesterase PaaI-like protein
MTESSSVQSSNTQQAQPEKDGAPAPSSEPVKGDSPFRRWLFKTYINCYPPLWGAGIKVTEIGEGYRSFKVQMKLTRWNKNYFGSQYGGSLYSMCDPFYALILIKALGKNYFVVDKAATIQYKRPGTGTVYATFQLSPERIAETKARADRLGKVDETFDVQIVDGTGQVIADVQKVVHVRPRGGTPAASGKK